MNTALWIAQGMLAFIFLSSGVAKAVMSPEMMARTGQSGVAGLPLPFVRFVAISELLGAIGLVAPWALGVGKILTPLASVGLGIVMLGALTVHFRLREPGNVALAIFLFCLCAFVAYGRA